MGDVTSCSNMTQAPDPAHRIDIDCELFISIRGNRIISDNLREALIAADNRRSI